LLVVSAALFAVGVGVEHAGGETHKAAATTESAGHTETGEEGTESSNTNAAHSEAKSPATVIIAVVVSLLLAAGVWRYPRPPPGDAIHEAARVILPIGIPAAVTEPTGT
jgi:hypothetical protein